jgi:uncharacterized phosphatase
MKLYFARHGQTDSNAGIMNGQTVITGDEPINTLGIQQANELAEQLKDIQFDVIISSPLKRAVQTAEIVNKYHHLPVEIIDDLQERKAPVYIDMNTWNDMFDFDKNLMIKNVESITDFFDRIYTSIQSLYERYHDKTILVVSHGGVHHALYAYANNLPLSGDMLISRTKNCEYKVYDIDDSQTENLTPA